MDQTTVIINLNGKNAEEAMQRLEQRAADLHDAFAKAAKAGNNIQMKQIKQELNSTNREIRQMRSSLINTEETLKKLDKATPRELRAALKELNRQSEQIERGTAAWKRHQEQIARVKRELQEINSFRGQTLTLGQRFRETFGNLKNMVVAGAVVSGIKKTIDMVSGLVTASADLQKVIARLSAITGIAGSDMDYLQQAFKNIDTATSREELNKLAIDAGKLGLKSKEDVLQFVIAADRLRVSLADLGEDAPLQATKIANIFGEMERLGVEGSLNAVGSAIAALAKNGTSNQQAIVDFTARLAGVGNQAKMTVPEIMALGAVLDENEIRVEMAGTAVQRVIMDLYTKTDKFAKALNLTRTETEKLTQGSTADKLLFLLQKLNEQGGIDKLAPLFGEMGENGERVKSTLMVMANQYERIAQMMQFATDEYNRAEIVSEEFAKQNTTAASEIQKQRKAVHELATDIGDILTPAWLKILSIVKDIAQRTSDIIMGNTNSAKAARNVASMQEEFFKTLSQEEQEHFQKWWVRGTLSAAQAAWTALIKDPRRKKFMEEWQAALGARSSSPASGEQASPPASGAQVSPLVASTGSEASKASKTAERSKVSTPSKSSSLSKEQNPARELYNAYQEALIAIDELYIKSDISNERRLEARKEAEISYLNELRNLYQVGSQEYIDADQRLRRAVLDSLMQQKEALEEVEGTVKNTSSAYERMAQRVAEFFDSEQWKSAQGTINTVISGMSDIFSGALSLMQAEADFQTALIEKKYSEMAEAAQGNRVMEARAEKAKEQELQQLQSDAARRSFAIQIAMAIAQTAQSAIAAYSSAASIPVTGFVMAPVAAAMATAAGALQIATIKKQAEMAEAGFAEGGYTGRGSKYQVAGIVHAGEYVIPAHMVSSPRYAPVIASLEHDRTHQGAAHSAGARGYADGGFVSDNRALLKAIERLNQRLNEPFVTVNTITGDNGIQRALNRYNKLTK